MSVNNITKTKINCSIEEFFNNYLKLYYKFDLTDNEIKVLSKFMEYYNKYSKSITDDNIIFELIFSSSNRKNIREELNEKVNNFNTIFSTLKKKLAIIQDGNSLKLDKSLCLNVNESYQIVYEFRIS